MCAEDLEGCARCNSSAICSECKSTYYLEQPSWDCLPCDHGCAYCLAAGVCANCYYGFYLDSSACLPCPDVDGCLACINETYCQICSADYYLDLTGPATQAVCVKCDRDLSGCYSCTDSLSCSTCLSGYQLNNDTLLCVELSIQGTISSLKKGELKLVTRYVSQSLLSHTLYSRVHDYDTQGASLDDIIADTKIVYEDVRDYKQYALSILEAEWQSKDGLVFYTDNPLGLGSGDN